MLRTLCIHIFLVFLCLHSAAQASRKGVPLVRNYTPEEFRGTEQNWAVVQDNRGILYVGNNDHGVMEYDGESWRHIRVPNNSIVRSLAFIDGIIYVGTVDEFGYLAPDELGQLSYQSLAEQLDSADRKFGDIWRIYERGNDVFFSADLDKLFVFENLVFKKTYSIPFSPLFTFVIDTVIYAGTFRAGLLSLQNDTFLPAPKGDHFIRKSILSMLPHRDGRIQIGTIPGGVTIYDPATGDVSFDFPSPLANQFLAENLIYHAIPLPDEQVAYATLNKGVLIVDREGQIQYIIDRVAGLQNDIVSYLYHRKEDQSRGPLWIALSSGISKVEINSAFSVFGDNFGIKGSVLDVQYYHGVLYIGTLSGLFYQYFDGNRVPRFRAIGEIENACWSMIRFRPPGGEERLLAATQRGIYEISDTNRIRCIEESISPENPIYQQAFKIQASRLYPERIYIGTKTGLSAFSCRQGTWEKEGNYSMVPRYEIRSIAEGKDGSLWLGTLFNGLIRVRISNRDTLVQLFDQSHHLPSIKNNLTFVYLDEPVFATHDGMMRFDEEQELFLPHEAFPEILRDGSRGVYRFIPNSDGSIWLVSYTDEKSWVEKLIPSEDRAFTIDSLSYKRLPSREIEAVFTDPERITWFGVSNRLFSFSGSPDTGSARDFQISIRKVSLNDEKAVYYGHVVRKTWELKSEIPVMQWETPEFRYQYNNISFEYAAPFFIEEEATRYSYILEGLQKSWSRWTTDARVSFNNLKEGKYHFRVKAKNIFDEESAIASYDFEILPPIHRTIYAYILYGLSLLGLIWLIVTLYSRRLIREKQRLERIVTERTREIVEQKQEIEKQRDLAHRQKEQIEAQNIEIKDSIKYARRIQTAILPPADHLADILPESFVLNIPKDIVSGDFYWFSESGHRFIIAVADCTGHGVPGAFMSMLGMTFLNEIVNKSHIVQPAEILNHLRIHVVNALHQRGELGESQDGMDISLISLDFSAMKLEYAGAYNPLIVVRDGDLTVLKGDKMPIGISARVGDPFFNQSMELRKGDALYAFSDGYADQFGGENDKKFTIRSLKSLILDIHTQPFAEQRQVLENTFQKWKGSREQLDDILVLGLKVQ